jgi:glycosyltransferase involved in cell wall biosynthesis
MLRTLYLCYFGLREPLVQSQVLPYLRYLAAQGIEVSLLTFEPDLKERWSDDEVAAQTAGLARDGIRWFALPYHKRPSAPATAYDILAGARMAVRLIRRHKIDVLHARSHVPLAMALLARRVVDCRIIFDIRGLLAEEYADSGIWTESSRAFRAVKRLERAGIRRADQLVVLTRRMRDWLVENNLAPAEKVEVIPCCVDFSRFALKGSVEEPGAERFEVVYAGAATGLYLLKEMAEFFLAVRERRADAFLRIMTASPRDAVVETLRRAGLSEDDFWVGAVKPAEVPLYLRHARLGLSFRAPTFSQIAASPTKIPEYLAAGVVAVSNSGIGDTDELLRRERVGVVVNSFDPASYREAAAQALGLLDEPGINARCVEVAHRYFDLAEVGGARYYEVYRRVAEKAREREAESA